MHTCSLVCRTPTGTTLIRSNTRFLDKATWLDLTVEMTTLGSRLAIAVDSRHQVQHVGSFAAPSVEKKSYCGIVRTLS